jgi:hypothetical protein
MNSSIRVAALAAAVLSTAALADEYKEYPVPPPPAEVLPAPRSDNDPRPPVARPGASDGSMQGSVVQQAGVGGPTAYGRRGVVELGGSASFTTASTLTSFSVNPSIGWFFVDNFELSAILGAQYSNVMGQSSAFLTALAEPSYHLPFSNSIFGFVGVGMGVGYVTDVGTGFALAPRIGANFLIGRSGVLSPAAFLNYSTAGLSGDGRGTTLRVNATYGAQVGYTVML